MLVSRFKYFYVVRLTRLLEPEDEELARQVEYDMDEQGEISSAAHCIHVFKSLSRQGMAWYDQ